ncbi:rifin [Plasmodium sp. gorilla clade G1]|nr:rifin [Plasmodium sp. gorilla clade G1]
MKIHYTKIILFSLALNILLSSSCAHSKNKPYTTSHIRNTTSRVLSECDVHTSIYDNDADMKSVKENFNRQASQRFEEYEKLMIIKRQKCKEQCDKDIQKIIVKDKIQKSLAQKVEKGCLMCACGLGGGVAPVWGLVSGLWYASWTHYVATTVNQAATKAGIEKAIEGLGNIYTLNEFSYMDWAAQVTPRTYGNVMELVKIVNSVNNMCDASESAGNTSFCTVSYTFNTRGNGSVFMHQISKQAAEVAADAGEAARLAEATEASKFLPKTTILTNTIIASIVAIVVIVLVMLIIYLILLYRRKKKIKKRQQYTKLLKE